MAGTNVWLVCFKQNKTKDARSPLASLCEKQKCKVKQTNQPGRQNPSPTRASVMTSQHCLLLFSYGYSGLMNFALISFSTFVMTPISWLISFLAAQ